VRATWIAAVITLAATTAAAQTLTPAQLEQRDAHASAAVAYYENGNFEGAITEYRAAYAIDPQPDFVFAMAMIEQQRGGCAEAVRLADEFAATAPPAEDVEVLEAAIADCRERVAPLVVDSDPPPAGDAAMQPPPTEPPPVAQRPFYTDRLADTLVGLGVAVNVGAIVLFVRSRGQLDDAEEPGLTQDEYQARWDRASSTQVLSSVAGSFGLALVAVGVHRWITGDRPAESSVSVEPTSGGAQVNAAWRF
jgi:tetratricopeptide (TPR) repeat protein